MAAPLRIGLVDDHRILLDGLEALLSAHEEFAVVLKEERGFDLTMQPDLDQLDVLVMDVNLPDQDGIAVLKTLRLSGFSGTCIMLSSYDDLHLVQAAMDAGANGYVTKSSAPEYLEAAILAVVAGEKYYSPDIQERILRAFHQKSKPRSENPEEGLLRQLTSRELEVLKLIASQFTSDEIAEQLHIAKSTVDTHRKNLIYKLKVRNAVGLGLFAERNGLI